MYMCLGLSSLPYCYADVFSGIDRSGPFSIRYGALPRAQTLCFKVENSLMVMLALSTKKWSLRRLFFTTTTDYHPEL